MPARVTLVHMIRYCFTIAEIVATALALVACGGPSGGEPALPHGLEQATTPSGVVNAYAFVHASSPLMMTTDHFGYAIETRNLNVERIEVSVQDIGLFSARLLFTEIDEAEAVSLLQEFETDSKGMSSRSWSGKAVTFSRGNLDDGRLMSIGWHPDADLVRERFPMFWNDLRLAPSEPPEPPLVAGFVRNAGDLLDMLIASSGIAVPNLSDALTLVRIGEVTFVGYAADVASLPTSVDSDVLSDFNVSVLAIATSSYPAAIVGQVFEGFAGALGLTPIEIDGRTAHARLVTPEIYLIVLRQGATLFFSIAPTRVQAEALLSSLPRS